MPTKTGWEKKTEEICYQAHSTRECEPTKLHFDRGIKLGNWKYITNRQL